MERAELEKAFKDFARNDVESALELITGCFVGLTEAYIEVNQNKEASEKNIRVKGGKRMITIHAQEIENS